MGRKPVHLTAASGKPSGRQAIWQSIRQLRRFTVIEVADACRQNPTTVRTYLKCLEAGGYLSSGDTAPKVYELVRDTGFEAPRVKNDGSPVVQGLGQEQMWRAMKMLTDFTARDLALAASTEAVQISYMEAQHYLRYLTKAGYVIADASATARRQAAYRFIRARNTGPRAPMIQRTKAVFDPNLSKVVWLDEEALDR